MAVTIRALKRGRGRDWRLVVDGKASRYRLRPARPSDGQALRAGQYVIVNDAQQNVLLYAGTYRFFSRPDDALRAVREHGISPKAIVQAPH